jgi:hypothetical protein
MGYFQNLFEKTKIKYVFENPGEIPLFIHNMRKIKNVPLK